MNTKNKKNVPVTFQQIKDKSKWKTIDKSGKIDSENMWPTLKTRSKKQDNNGMRTVWEQVFMIF